MICPVWLLTIYKDIKYHNLSFAVRVRIRHGSYFPNRMNKVYMFISNCNTIHNAINANFRVEEEKKKLQELKWGPAVMWNHQGISGAGSLQKIWNLVGIRNCRAEWGKRGLRWRKVHSQSMDELQQKHKVGMEKLEEQKVIIKNS